MLNEPGWPTVNVAVLMLVIVGAVGVGAGVTITGSDGGLAPTLLVAVTVQAYVTPLVRPAMAIGETMPVPKPVGVQEAV